MFSPVPDPWLVGLLFAARGAGAAVGSLCGRLLFGETRTALLWSSLAGFPVLALSYGALSQAPTIALAALFVFCAGVGNSLIRVGSSILLQRVDPVFHGRAFSLDFGLMAVVQAAAILTVSGLVDAGSCDPRQAMAICALAAVPPGILLGLGALATRLPAAARRPPATPGPAPD